VNVEKILALTSDMTLTAYYEQAVVQHSLFIGLGAGGITNPVAGTILYNEGSSATVAAIPNSGYRFLNWTLDGANRTENPISIPMNADHSIMPAFEVLPPPPPEKRYLTIVAINGQTNPTPNTYEANLGSTIPVTATPDSGYKFKEWVLDNVQVGTQPFYTVTMDQNHTLVAVFEEEVTPPNKATVVISVTGNGSTNPAVGVHTEFDIGSTLQVIGIPEIGWYCTKMKRNGVDWTEDNPGTFTNLAQTESIEVIFQEFTTTTGFPFKGLERFPRLYELAYGIWERWQERKG